MKVRLCCGVLCEFVIFLFRFFFPRDGRHEVNGWYPELTDPSSVHQCKEREERRRVGVGVGSVCL